MSLRWVEETEKSVLLCGQDQQKQEAVKYNPVNHITGPDNALSYLKSFENMGCVSISEVAQPPTVKEM